MWHRTARFACPRALIQELREGDYIDAFTRAVFVEFTTYNANLEVLCLTSAARVCRVGLP